MILPDLQAVMKCDEPNCAELTPVRLALALSGGFVFLPPDAPGWQMSIDPKRSGGSIMCYCRAHNRKVDTGNSKLVTFRGSH